MFCNNNNNDRIANVNNCCFKRNKNF